MNFFKVIANKEVLFSYSSMLTRLLIGFVLYPVIASFTPIVLSVWLFGQILSRIRDIMDIGFLGNFTRQYSYNHFKDKKNGARFLFSCASKIYRYLFLSCLLAQSALAAIWVHFTDADELVWVVAYLCYVVLSNSIYLFGNLYQSFLYGTNRISQLRFWDTLFNAICLVLIFAVARIPDLSYSALLMLPTLNIALVVRNYLLSNKYLREYDWENNYTRVTISRIIVNAKRDFKGSAWLATLLQGVNFLISIFAPINIANLYLFVDQISEHIRNLSRVPFYVRRPTWGAYFKRVGFLPQKDVVFAFLLSLVLLIISFLTLLVSLDAFVRIFDLNIDLNVVILFVFMIYSLIERVSAMMNQIVLIVENKVRTNIYYRNVAITCLPLTVLYLYLGGDIIYLPIIFSVCYLFLFAYPILNRLRRLNSLH